MRCLAIVTALIIILISAAPGRPAVGRHLPSLRRPNCGKLAARAELRCARIELRIARQAPGPHSHGFWRWRMRLAKGWIKAARYRISHPPIAHERLWLCIHSFEGAWPDDTGNGYYGGLQMLANWGPYGRPLVWHANLLSPYGQMAVAERGYRIVAAAQGWTYARTVWLPSQWYHPSCFQYA